MSVQDSKTLSFTAPVIVILFFLQEASGVAQTIGGLVASAVTVYFIGFAAQWVWTPLLKKAGFWASSFLLGCAVVAVGLAAATASSKVAGFGYAFKLSENSAVIGLLFSWALAAIRGAQDKKRHGTPSVLFHPHLFALGFVPNPGKRSPGSPPMATGNRSSRNVI